MVKNNKVTAVEEVVVSKTARKKEMLQLQEWGAFLAGEKAVRLQALDLPAALQLAFAETVKMRSHGSRRRHFQYIGKLMRELNDEQFTRVKNYIDACRQAGRKM